MQIKKLTTGLFLFLLTKASVAEELVLVANFWEPFTGEALQYRGAASQIVSEIMQRKGHRTQIIIMPWARILVELRREKPEVDGVVAIWMTQERKRYVKFSHAYFVNNLCLIKRVDDPFEFHGSLQELTGKLIGIGRHYAYSDRINQATNFDRAESVNLGQSLMRLQRGRLDLVLSDCDIARFHIQNLHPAEATSPWFRLFGDVVERSPLYFGVHRNQANANQLIRDFNEGLAEMLKEGTYQRVLGQWNIRPPTQTELSAGHEAPPDEEAKSQ